MTKLRLIVFDVDGTLVDSQAEIVAAFTAMYAAAGRPVRPRPQLLSVVGLSLPIAISRLEPDLSSHDLDIWSAAYRDAFSSLRASQTPAPLYPGARDLLEALKSDPAVLLGVATGKSRRGVDHVLSAHRLEGMFDTVQTADDHPSKPHPSMLNRALLETGVEAERAVFVGDTTFDIQMGRAAGIATIGVSWGYHPSADLRSAGADAIVDRCDALVDALRMRGDVSA